MDTPWSRARKARHLQQEESLNQLQGGRKTPGSGRIWRFPRDGRLWDFLIEARTTIKESYRIQKHEFLQMKQEAITTPPGLMPGMQIDLQDLKLIVIELHVFQDMCARLVALEESDEG